MPHSADPSETDHLEIYLKERIPDQGDETAWICAIVLHAFICVLMLHIFSFRLKDGASKLIQVRAVPDHLAFTDHTEAETAEPNRSS